MEYSDKNPVIARDALILRGAVVEGDVTIGSKTSVWHNAVIRGDFAPITIGAESNVQDCAVIHADAGKCVTVGNRVTIGHGAVLHGCTVEDGAVIGMNAVVLDGAVVGKNAVVGANSFVKHGQQIPPGMLAVGTPAKVLRPLTAEEIKDFQENVGIYLDLRAKHASLLK